MAKTGAAAGSRKAAGPNRLFQALGERPKGSSKGPKDSKGPQNALLRRLAGHQKNTGLASKQNTLSRTGKKQNTAVAVRKPKAATPARRAANTLAGRVGLTAAQRRQLEQKSKLVNRIGKPRK
ncbi:hypothetical protein OGAPHI_004198 [Ogataea philodendri]|uniref:Uncharacterized protein n=1 Tax=Ogataea philodendri TaxID=1378263 RepID=A0A9P8P6T8_9ASCO|nr:uncharacterized protein OGAPHI_004198 [Ogataea philodendri]KAH3666009.1 hypothetical protein OGAPHI_004198 [Ogataea philodendri]